LEIGNLKFDTNVRSNWIKWC